jgi:hypothetical protein
MLSPLHLPSSLVSILLLALPLNTFASSPFVASPSAAKIRPRSGVAQNVLESKPETRGYCSVSCFLCPPESRADEGVEELTRSTSSVPPYSSVVALRSDRQHPVRVRDPRTYKRGALPSPTRAR